MISVLENWIGTRNSEIPKNPTCGTRRIAPKKATKLAVGLRYFGRIRLSTHMNGFIDIFPFSSFSTDKTIAQLRVWEPGVECKKQLNFTSEDNIKAINYTKPCFLYTLKCLLPVYSNAINKSERYWNRWAIYVCVVCVVPGINDPQSLDVLCFECKPMHIDGLKIEWKAEKTRKKRCQQQTSHYGVMMPAVGANDRNEEAETLMNAKIKWNVFNLPILRNSMDANMSFVKLARVICVNSSVAPLFYGIQENFAMVACFFPRCIDCLFFLFIQSLNICTSVTHSPVINQINFEWTEWRMSKTIQMT